MDEPIARHEPARDYAIEGMTITLDAFDVGTV